MSVGSLRCECSDSWVDEHFLAGFGMDQLTLPLEIYAVFFLDGVD